LFVPLSQGQKVYVQHRMVARAPELYRALVTDRGSVFVCGDGAQMARDVDSSLTDILAVEGDLTVPAAAAMLADMAKQQRYVRDIWS
jgi:sulfite reductase alpha subunit-like flavoprotein